MNKCEKFGFLHYRTDPCRSAIKSASSPATKPPAVAVERSAHKEEMVGPENPQVYNDDPACSSPSSSLSPILKPRGRPKTIHDMKAYKAAKQREYRARQKP